MSLNGTDISGYQPGNPNLTGDAFSIVKATEGVGYSNSNWSAQVDACRADGAMVGHYHFANGLNTPQAEARYFWSVVSTKWKTGEPLALDIEGSFFTNAANPVQWALEFAQELYSLTDLKSIIYMDWQHLKNTAYNWQPLVDYNCGLWGAAYNNTGFGDPSPWSFLVLWQNADTNASGGDSDVLYGDASTFTAYGTPQGATVVLGQDDIDAITTAVVTEMLGHGIPRQGTGQTGDTSLSAVLAWFDANMGAVVAGVNSHTDSSLKALTLPTPQVTLTDSQVTDLANLLIAKLPPAQITALAAQLQK